MPYRRRTEPVSIDSIRLQGIDVPMTPPAGLDVELFYLERMMEFVGVPNLTVATAPELHDRILTWSYGQRMEGLELPAIIGKYLGTTVSANPMLRAEFNRKARKHLWATMRNYVQRETQDIIYTEE
jgi:hypothetical protein